ALVHRQATNEFPVCRSDAGDVSERADHLVPAWAARHGAVVVDAVLQGGLARLRLRFRRYRRGDARLRPTDGEMVRRASAFDPGNPLRDTRCESRSDSDGNIAMAGPAVGAARAGT